MADKRVLEFNALPELTRKRFTASIGQVAEPKPLYMNEATTISEGPKGMVAAVGGVVLFAYLIFVGLGESIDWDVGFMYVVAGAAVVVGLMLALRAKAVRKRLPYVEGTYLFPVDLVLVKGGKLTLEPISSLTGLHVFNHPSGNIEMRLTFASGTTHSLLVDSKDRAQRLSAQLQAEQARFAAAASASDMQLFARYDIFFEARTGGEWDRITSQTNAAPSGSPAVAKVPLWVRHTIVIGGGLGFALGVGVAVGRNIVSDELMFTRAKDRMTVESLNGYLQNGGTRHADEVQGVLLPRAELDVAKAKNSVTSLREYRERYPGGAHDDEAREAIHALFVTALEKFEGQAKRSDPKVREHIRALFAWLEANDSPPVEIRFRAPDPQFLQEVDAELAGGAEEAEVQQIVAISPSFSADRTAQREAWILTQLASGFAQVVPLDILDLQQGAALRPDSDIAELKPERATIAVSYLIDASGSIYSSDDKIKGYIGISVSFVVTMLVPGLDGQPGPEPLSFVLTVEPPQEFIVTTDGIAIQASDQLVYDVMAKEAFEALDSKLRGALFSAGDSENLEVVSGAIPEFEAPAEPAED